MKDYYIQSLLQNGFKKIEQNGNYCSMGTCWQLSNSIGRGEYWVYEQKNLYTIKIHNFFFHKNTVIEQIVPECISITYYESISGEELITYERLDANCIKSFIGKNTLFKANIDKKVPICSIGIDIFPEYYKEHLKKIYPDEYENPFRYFQAVNDNFPEMAMLLTQIKNYRGNGISAKLFYDAKVAEVVSLVVEHHQKKSKQNQPLLSDEDKQLIISVASYINEHYASAIKQEFLAKIACMGSTKLKKCFKLHYGCTITEYIQHRRLSQAEQLLSSTNITISQVAQTVGYHSASRFSELFRKNMGISPNNFRMIMKEKKLLQLE